MRDRRRQQTIEYDYQDHPQSADEYLHPYRDSKIESMTFETIKIVEPARTWARWKGGGRKLTLRRLVSQREKDGWGWGSTVKQEDGD